MPSQMTQQQMPDQTDPQAEQQAGQHQGSSAGGWVRLEEVINYLRNVDKNREGHDVEIAAKSNTSGIHKFEITVKEKPMLQKANGMNAAASKPKVEVRVAMTVEDGHKLLRSQYPTKFLKAMGLA
jgi:hypothetical protein